jgi:hypothetical protein
LDLIGEALEHEEIKFTRLDGTLQQAQREKVLNTFAGEEKGVNVLLISLRAGGVGLNLTCTNHVVMMVKKKSFSCTYFLIYFNIILCSGSLVEPFN